MWAFTVVVGHPLRQDPPQMPLVERNHPIETLAPSGPNESLAVPVGLRRAEGCLQHAQRHAVQRIVNRWREDAVAIVHEEAIGPIEGKAIPELLDGPLGRGMPGDVPVHDLSGNNAAGTLRNATIEGVADKVEVHTGDARKLPFPDASFDVVLSSMALHNIYNAGERQAALLEIARVLAPGGRVLIVDVRHTSKYAVTLRDVGLTDARCVQGVFSYLLTLITIGSVGWGCVIGTNRDAI